MPDAWHVPRGRSHLAELNRTARRAAAGADQIRFYGIQHYDPWILPNAVDFLVRTADKFPLTNVVSHEFPLDQIGKAFETAEWVGRNAGSEVTRAVVAP